MALVLNEEQQSLKDIAKEFLQKNAPVTHFREIRDTENELGMIKTLETNGRSWMVRYSGSRRIWWFRFWDGWNGQYI